MDRNLGASRVAQSSTDSEAYGDLFQWGRLDDGHQVRTSGETTTQSTGDVPNHSNFIKGSSDWRNPANNSLWQGVNGINNPCPPGWRIPTTIEWGDELNSWGSNKNATGAFNSSLKLPRGGLRNYVSGVVGDVGSGGYYWSSAVSGIGAQRLYFYSTGANAGGGDHRAYGFSVRCLKD